jgi:peptidoglycan/LPS O-acetylase OafA/YrhL
MRRLVCLDGLRGVLAFYVMLSHSLPFAPLPHWLHWMLQHGGAGVDVFFVLSGLVIVQSLASFEYQPLPFLIARVARIYPVFLVVFAFAIVVQPLATSFEDMAWIGPDSGARYLWAGGWPSNWGIGIATHLTMTHGLFPDGVLPGAWVAFLGTAWSLSTEWQFYVLALLLGHRLGLVRMAALFLALAAVSLIWQVAMPEAWQFSRAFLPNKAQYFALGVVSAIVVREEPGALRLYLAVLASVLALCLLRGGFDKLLPPLIWTACLAAQLWSSPQRTGQSRARMLAFAQRTIGWLAALLQSPPLVWLGAVSYCIYLVHEPVQRLLGIVLASLVRGDAPLFTALWIPGAVVLPVLAAWWLHAVVEVPALRYGRGMARASLSAGRMSSIAATGLRGQLWFRSASAASPMGARLSALAHQTRSARPSPPSPMPDRSDHHWPPATRRPV